MSKRAIAYVGLGANLGDTVTTLQQALIKMRIMNGILLVKSSPFYRSTPLKAVGPDFINAVACLHTTLLPLELLDTLQLLENEFGRTRPYFYAPRTLDLDLLVYEDEVICSPRLTLPHPRLHERAFVLRPLFDLAPDMILAHGSVQTLLKQCADQPIVAL